MPRLRASVIAIVLLLPSPVPAQTIPWHARGYAYRRTITVPTPQARLVQVQMLTHGLPADRVLVFSRGGPRPVAVLQRGPGDHLRIAFAPAPRRTKYWIYFGADEATVPAQRIESLRVSPPPVGLLLETREFVGFDLHSLDALRAAFDRAKPFGAVLVPQVFHRVNPSAPGAGPFITHYTGTLRVHRSGQYRFFTTSQDCSFLLVDGKLVASAPGRHGPVPRARYGGTIRLETGPHRFDYWHAASGMAACMVAAWQPPGASKPEVIPPEAFAAEQLVNAEAAALEHRSGRDYPDFMLRVQGAIEIPGPNVRLVHVRARWLGTRGRRAEESVQWDFGDGQVTEGVLEPEHVYLHPGQFTVRVRLGRRSHRRLEVASRIRIWPLPPGGSGTARTEETLEAYARLLERYDPAALDADSLVVLVRTWVYLERWDAVVDTAIKGLGGEVELGEIQLEELVERATEAARFRLGRAEAAAQLLRLACDKAADRAQRARFAVRLADVLLNDLAQRRAAQVALAQADAPSRLQDRRLYLRVRADVRAREGQADEARADYREAARLRERSVLEAVARRGAYQRTVEGLLREQRLQEAYAELVRWCDEFPDSKLDGSWHLLAARYWLAAGRVDQVFRVVQDAITVAPDSQYADQLVWLEAQAALQSGKPARAVQAMRTLLEDYPGSPLVPDARKLLDRLQQP